MCGVQLFEVEGWLPVSCIYFCSDAVRFTWTTMCVCVQWLYLPAPSEACRPEQAMMRVKTRTQTRHADGAMARRRLGRWCYCELLIPCPHPHWGAGHRPPGRTWAVRSHHVLLLIKYTMETTNKICSIDWIPCSTSNTVSSDRCSLGSHRFQTLTSHVTQLNGSLYFPDAFANLLISNC